MDENQQVERFIELVRAHAGRGMSRREFLRRGLALGLSLPAAIGVLASCGAAPAAPTTATPPAPAPAQPRQGAAR